MSFATAITGIKAASTDLDVRGNNIANVSTVGFKSSRVEFGDVYSSTLFGGGSSNVPGGGVSIMDLAQNHKGGTIEFTQNNLDLAIDGGGFFQLKNSAGAITYTRAGNFELVPDDPTQSNSATGTTSILKSKNGSAVQGRIYNDAGVLTGGEQDIIITSANKTSAPKSTTKTSLSLNIDSRLDPTKLKTPYNPADPTTYTYGTSTRFYDSLGNPQTLVYHYLEVVDPNPPSATNTLTYYQVKVHRLESNGSYTELPLGLRDTGGAGTTTSLVDQTTSDLVMAFNRSTGVLESVGLGNVAAGTVGVNPAFTPTAPTTGLVAVNNGAAPDIFIGNTDPTKAPTTTFPSTVATDSVMTLDVSDHTQYASSSIIKSTNQDGYPTGQLAGVKFESNGDLVASYTNGQSKRIAQIQLFSFDNPQGLLPVGDTSWVSTNDSGPPVGNPPGTGLNGSLKAAALEQSNVDLSEELVGLIIAQRNYQANSKTLETQNAVTQTILNIR